MLGAATAFLVTGMGTGDREGLIAGIIFAIVTAVGGAAALIMAIIRWRWFRAARRALPAPTRHHGIPGHPARSSGERR